MPRHFRRRPVEGQSRPEGLHLERVPADGPDIGRWEAKPEPPRPALLPALPSILEGPVTKQLRHLLGEITADRDRLDTVNGRLLAENRVLRARLEGQARP